MGWRRVIIVRKDLNMSHGKMAAMVGHAVEAYYMSLLKEPLFISKVTKRALKPLGNEPEEDDNEIACYDFEYCFDKDMYEQYICGTFTKTVCEAKNKNQLLKAKKIAEDLGLKEGIDFWLIKDNCYTELQPEEYDENGVGRCLTCIGFRPLPDEVAHKISKKFQLYIE